MNVELNEIEEIAELPKSITAIIRLMDVLEPGHFWYDRQKDTRGECSKTRAKLRKFARANPDHPAIAHWCITKKWAPPNVEVLYLMIQLMKEMIK